MLLPEENFNFISGNLTGGEVVSYSLNNAELNLTFQRISRHNYETEVRFLFGSLSNKRAKSFSIVYIICENKQEREEKKRGNEIIKNQGKNSVYTVSIKN